MINRNNSSITLPVYFILMIFLFFTLEASAEDLRVVAQEFSFNITFPANQQNKSLGYYDLMMKSNEKQELVINLENPTNKSILLNVNINGAKTNSNGLIEYGENNIKNDESLIYDFNDIVASDNEVSLKPKEKKKLIVTIKTPKSKFKGIIAGGVELIEKKEKTEATQLDNEYFYIVPIVLRENKETVKPELFLNSVSAGNYNGKNAIFIDCSNIKPMFVNNMDVKVKITKKNEKKVLFEKKKEGMRMAPNSVMRFPVV